MSDYQRAPARYAKGKVILHCPSPDGYKTRAANLAERLANGRYSHRSGGYVLSPTAADRFERLYALGWNASPFSGQFISPEGYPVQAAPR